MRTRYREKKATEAAARLLKLRGGAMSHMKLIKLLYLVDREALIRWGRPVTYDTFVSMPHGPVLSLTLSRINEPEFSPGAYWHRYIGPKNDNAVSLVDDAAPSGHLSPAEERLIDEVFEQYGHLNRWKLVAVTHELPEWEDPQGSSRPLDPADILRNAGYSEEQIREIESDLEESSLADALFG
jgi:uncharacterized phage-associated protein